LFKNILLAGVMALAALPACASQLPDYPFIHAKGSAFVFVMPDMGEIDFEIHAEDASPEAVTATVQTRIAEVQQLLSDQGLNADDVDFRSVQKSMVKSASDGGADTYAVKCAVHIVVRDLTKWHDVMLPLLNKPNIDALEANFSTTARAKLTQELMLDAVKDAQANAEAMAIGFGKHVGAVNAISSGELKNLSTSVGLVPGDFYYNAKEKVAEASRRPANPNDLLSIAALKMYQSVDVIFRIR
jgi:uncharacterized protein YggE